MESYILNDFEVEPNEPLAMRRTNQEKFRVVVLVSQAALQYIQGLQPSDYAVPEEEVVGTFDEESGSIVENPSNSTINGRTTDSDLPNRRQEIFGINLESVRKYFHEATTAVCVLCASIGTFIRVNDLISFFRSLSSERDETYTGYIRNLV